MCFPCHGLLHRMINANVACLSLILLLQKPIKPEDFSFQSLAENLFLT
jgi:hypothetical protein